MTNLRLAAFSHLLPKMERNALHSAKCYNPRNQQMLRGAPPLDPVTNVGAQFFLQFTSAPCKERLDYSSRNHLHVD
jgi:hypothetical protein